MGVGRGWALLALRGTRGEPPAVDLFVRTHAADAGPPGPSVARRVTSMREDLNARLHNVSTSMRAPTGMRS